MNPMLKYKPLPNFKVFQRVHRYADTIVLAQSSKDNKVAIARQLQGSTHEIRRDEIIITFSIDDWKKLIG